MIAYNFTAIEAEDGKRYIPIAISPNSGSVIIQAPTHTQSSQKEKRPKRTGSLGLFFRKVFTYLVEYIVLKYYD